MGSIPTAVWLGKVFFGIDVREYGSKNAGATNTIRTLGLPTGLLVFAIDLLKGFGAASLYHFLPVDFAISWSLCAISFGIFAVLGHIFPVFAHFRGGKGVATLCGVVFALHPLATLCALGVFALVLVISRYVSLGSMLAGISFPFFLFFLFRVRDLPLLIFAIVVALLLLFTHRKNIGRLLSGTESRFSPKRKGAANS
jgi:acyl-phosphate glycerol 3-phosphate acyltransferase